jgi:predicted RNase H-like HicB family nuclease
LATCGRLLIGPHPAGESQRSLDTRAHCALTQHPWLLTAVFFGMTRTYSLVIEGAPNEYSAYMPELPAILVTGGTIEELTDRAGEAILVYWETLLAERSPTSTVREIEVELPT